MAARFDLVTIDCPQPDRSAAFWSSALGLHETEREDGDRWIVLSDNDGVRRLGLQRGSARPGGVHLDLVCAPFEFEHELERLIAAGATLQSAPRHEPYGAIANLTDPDGYAFDLCAYH
jgi:catechol 2,3-dioxygenase-like lactoylglutathione lyase family enzyme